MVCVLLFSTLRPSSFAIILMEKRAGCFILIVFLMSCDCYVLWFFLSVPRVGLQCAIMVFLDHTHLFLISVIKLLYQFWRQWNVFKPPPPRKLRLLLSVLRGWFCCCWSTLLFVWGGGGCWSSFWYNYFVSFLVLHSSWRRRKRWLFSLTLLSFRWLVTVNVLWLFFTVP